MAEYKKIQIHVSPEEKKDIEEKIEVLREYYRNRRLDKKTVPKQRAVIFAIIEKYDEIKESEVKE